MSKWFQWYMLTLLTGNPLLSFVILLVAWWVMDRFTLGLLPDPFRFFRRYLRASALQRLLGHNPNDRRARLELATLYVERRRYARAVELLKPNLEAGDDDAVTLYTMGVACLGAGHIKQGELFLDEADARDPKFRMGEVHLESARWRLRRGDAKGALEPLAALVAIRPGTVEGKVLMAKAQKAVGDDVAAAYSNKDAWTQYVHSPRFQRKRDRLWAWRANPMRPALYLVLVLVCGALFTRFVAPSLQRAAEAAAQPVYAADDDE